MNNILEINFRPWLMVFGAVGGAVTSALGGWSTGMTVLVVCMGVDYLSGLLVAGVFRASKKSATGALESRAGGRGCAARG
jgi:phage-related holin